MRYCTGHLPTRAIDTRRRYLIKAITKVVAVGYYMAEWTVLDKTSRRNDKPGLAILPFIKCVACEVGQAGPALALFKTVSIVDGAFKVFSRG